MNVVQRTQAQSKRSSPREWWARNERRAVPYVLLVPFLVTLLVFTVYPVADSFILSFHRQRNLHEREYFGLANYERLLTKDKRFAIAIGNGAEFTAGTLLIQMPLALGVAMALNSPVVRFRTLARLAFFAPYITSAIVVGWIFSLVFNQRYGLLNAFLSIFSIEAQAWLRDTGLIMPALIILGLWTWVGSNSLFFLAGLQNVPVELMEAARIDGANSRQLFVNVTMPFLKPVFIFVTLTGTIGSFSLFAQPYLLFDSGAGPQDAGLFPLMYLFFMSFQGNTRMGYASAVGYLFTLIVLIITGIQLLLFRLWKT